MAGKWLKKKGWKGLTWDESGQTQLEIDEMAENDWKQLEMARKNI